MSTCEREGLGLLKSKAGLLFPLSFSEPLACIDGLKSFEGSVGVGEVDARPLTLQTLRSRSHPSDQETQARASTAVEMNVPGHAWADVQNLVNNCRTL